MKLGISSFSYGWAVGVPGKMASPPLDARELLQRAANFQVDVLQIGDNMPLHALSAAEFETIKRESVEKGILIEAGTRGFTPEHILKYLDIASELKSPILRVVTDTSDFKPSFDEVVSIAREMIPELKRRGIILAIENHDRFRAGELVRMMDSIGSDYVGICLDTVNSMGAAEGIETVVTALAPYTVNLHAKDFVVARVPHLMGFNISGVPAGQGMMNLPWILRTLRQHNRSFNIILEMWTPPEDTLEATVEKEQRWVDESLLYLRECIEAFR